MTEKSFAALQKGPIRSIISEDGGKAHKRTNLERLRNLRTPGLEHQRTTVDECTRV
jgi:hypothetical protein